MNAVLLVNPNSNASTTKRMCAIASRALGAAPQGWTMPHGPGMIVTADALAEAGRQVAAMSVPRDVAAVIVAAFGDPGAEALARRLTCPVIGIGAASARSAAKECVPFAVATTTPGLRIAIDDLMRRHAGAAPYIGCFVSDGAPLALMANDDALDAALLGAIEDARAKGAERIIIGGGPLGEAAERLRSRSPLPLLNPIICAADEVVALLEG